MPSAQRQYDLDLAAAMLTMAARIEPKSRKISDTLRLAASRILALTASLPDDPPAQLDEHGNKIQPASTPGHA